MNKQDFLNRFILQQNKQQIIQSQPFPSSTTRKTFKKAAVLMPLIQKKGQLHLIFTQRALHLKHHAGQISFPGGKYEPSDHSLAQTALRETEEEIGLQQKHINLIGHLPSITTGTGYHITPYIGLINSPQPLIIDHGEVKECFEIPFSFLLNHQHFSKQHFVVQKKTHFTYCCIYKNHLIWGATAQMLINLQHHLK